MLLPIRVLGLLNRLESVKRLVRKLRQGFIEAPATAGGSQNKFASLLTCWRWGEIGSEVGVA